MLYFLKRKSVALAFCAAVIFNGTSAISYKCKRTNKGRINRFCSTHLYPRTNGQGSRQSLWRG